jgi:SAM-dependent methyltransferase
MPERMLFVGAAFSLHSMHRDNFDMYQKSAQFYDLLYHFKDNDDESAQVVEIIRQKHPFARTLLDVACGTGRHLEYLTKFYAAEGLDLNPDLLELARKRCPTTPFHRGDMASFDLKRGFDVILILFSAISYVKTVENFKCTINCVAKHLNPGGLLVVEPFFYC